MVSYIDEEGTSEEINEPIVTENETPTPLYETPEYDAPDYQTPDEAGEGDMADQASFAHTATAYQCPNCSAALAFSPAEGKFGCEFCLSLFTEEELSLTNAAEKAKRAHEEAEDYCAHMQEYVCPSCGAEIVADEHTAADFCCYCHSPVILQGRLAGQMKPDKLIPFSIDRSGAQSLFETWAKRKIFAPKALFAPGQMDKIQGIYYPFWITDADTNATLKAKATRVRSWRSGNKIYTETSHYAVSRSGDIHFEDITTSALKEVDKTMLEGVLPYPSEQLMPFTADYLSGFFAKKRNIERDALTEEVREKMNSYATTLLRNTIVGYHSVVTLSCDVNVVQSHWEYALLPLWMVVYHGKNKKKSYTFALNGSTGKIYGRVPLSPLKLILFGLGVGVLTVLLTLLMGGML